MIELAGLLRRGLEDMVHTAWELYAGWEVAGQPIGSRRQRLLEEFRRTFCRPAHIHFMGLWDTVSLVGFTREREFPFSSRSSVVSHLRHAVSIDERRCKYRLEPFEQIEAPRDPLSWWRHIFGPRAESGSSKDLIELWFPGNHSDVGGGWSEDATGHKISAIPFQWIVAEAIKHGVQFLPGAVATIRRECPVKPSMLLLHHDMLSLRTPVYKAKDSNSRGSEMPNSAVVENGADKRPLAPEEASERRFTRGLLSSRYQPVSQHASNSGTPHQSEGSSKHTILPGNHKKYFFDSDLSNRPSVDTERPWTSELLPLLHDSTGAAFAPISAAQNEAGRAHNRFGSSRRSELAKPPRSQPIVVPKRPNSTGSTWVPSRNRGNPDRKGVYTWPSAKFTRLPSISSLTGIASRRRVSWPRHEPEISPVKRFNGRGNTAFFEPLLWWLVETFPFSTDVERADGAWRRQVLPNFGAPRPIPKHAKFHWSVFYRLRMVSDYNPANLPHEIGTQFLELVERAMPVPEDLRAGILEINTENIRASLSPVWNVIPDDLAQIER